MRRKTRELLDHALTHAQHMETYLETEASEATTAFKTKIADNKLWHNDQIIVALKLALGRKKDA